MDTATAKVAHILLVQKVSSRICEALSRTAAANACELSFLPTMLNNFLLWCSLFLQSMFVALSKLSELDRLEREAFESVSSVSVLLRQYLLLSCSK